MIEIAVADAETRALWKVVGELAGKLPGDWALIGGLMVQLHAVEHGFTDVRVTHDIDLLGQARPQGTLMRIDCLLRDEGFALEAPDLDGYAQRYIRNGVVIDVLAPDGIKPPPRLTDGIKAIAVPGGHQALDVPGRRIGCCLTRAEQVHDGSHPASAAPSSKLPQRHNHQTPATASTARGHDPKEKQLP